MASFFTPRRDVWHLLIIALITFVTAYLGIALTSEADGIASLWLANASAVGIMLTRPARNSRWFLAAAVAGILIANLLARTWPLMAFGFAAINAVEIALIIGLSRRWLGEQPDLSSSRSLAIFLAIGGVAGPMVSAGLATLFLALAGAGDLVVAATRWFAADSLGMIIVAPWMMALASARPPTLHNGRAVLEGILICTLTAAVAIGVFTQSELPILFLILPCLTLAAFRLSFIGAASALVMVSLISIVLSIEGIGLVAARLSSISDRVIFVQMFLSVATLATLPITSVLADRRRIASALATSERQVRRLTDALPVAIFEADAAGNVIYANAGWQKLRGGGGKDWLAAIARRSERPARSAWSAALQDGGAFTMDAEVVGGGDDQAFWSRLTIEPRRNADNILTGFVGAAVDIDQRVRAEQALAENERLYRLMADHSGDMIMRVGLNGERLYVSPACRRILGYEPEELVEAPDAGQIHPADRARVEQMQRSAAEDGVQTDCSYRQQRKDGSYVWLEATYRLVTSKATGLSLELVASVRDIGLRKKTEHEALESAARLQEANRLLVMAERLSGLGHFRLTKASGTLQWSDEVFRIHGRPTGAAPSLDDAIAAYHEDDRAMITAVVQAALRTGAPFAFDARLIHTDGKERHVRAHGQTELDERGGVTGLFGVFQDVSEQIWARVELQDALEKANHAAEAKSTFLATMSHEIRTPMTGVLGMVELLNNETDEVKRKTYLDHLAQSARLLITILDQILDFSKLDSGIVEIEDVPFDLKHALTTVLNLFDHAASAKGLLLRADLPAASEIHVSGDPTRLQQVVSNLVSNAIKFTDAGSIVLRVTQGTPSHGTGLWQFEVVDSGIGIPTDKIDRLFTPFVQADATTTRRFGGTGLGLAISRRLVDAMGGKIGVVSSTDKGSVFWFDLPLRTVAAAKRADGLHSPRSLEKALKPLRILLAEDNLINQTLVGSLVGRMGHHIDIVANGREAVEAVRAGDYDIVLMDMQMPEMDGLSATRMIRSMPDGKASVPIVALTADAVPERRARYDNSGLTDFLTKPVDVEKLQSALAQVTSQSTAQPVNFERENSEDHTAPIEPERLAELRSVLGDSNVDALLLMLIQSAKMTPGDIGIAAEAGDAQQVRTLAHSLRGAALNIGAIPVAQAAQRIETFDGGFDMVRELNAQLEFYCGELISALRSEPSAGGLEADRKVVTLRPVRNATSKG